MSKRGFIFIIAIGFCVLSLFLVFNYRENIKSWLWIQYHIINEKHACDFPSENNGWKKYGSSPIFGDASTGVVFDPFVYVQGDSLLIMILSERNYNTITRVESKDGIHWAQRDTLLKPIENTWEEVVNRACVLKVDSLWHMWYTGQSQGESKIGHAISLDGIHFRRDRHNPVLQPTRDDEGKSTMNPCVIYDNGIFKMWYAAGETYEPDVLFYAESKNGSNWQKRSVPILEKDSEHKWEKSKVGGCQVLKIGDNYMMYYIGYQNVDVARICYATSKDGIHWIRPARNLLIAPTKNSWDAEATYKPTVIERHDTLFMWYNGRIGSLERIGMAYQVIHK